MSRASRFLILLAVMTLFYLAPNIFDDGITIVAVHNKTYDGFGTGFYIDEKNIITASHVVEMANGPPITGNMEILDESGYWHKAEVVGIDTDSDIAVLRLSDPNNNIKPKSACSRRLKYEDVSSREVFYSKRYGYLRAAFFIDPYKVTYRDGEILGLDLESGSPHEVVYIMHDSKIIPGYSGSPLLDRNDCYLGMNLNIEIANPKISRAISLKNIEDIVPKLLKSGRIDMPFLGIILEQVMDKVFISGAIENSPSALLGDYGVRILKDVDIKKTYPAFSLISINGKIADRLDIVWGILKSLPSGSRIRILVEDSSGNIKTIDIDSGERFSMIRKYIPRARFMSHSPLLII